MASPAHQSTAPSTSDGTVLERLRAGDEATFADLVQRWSPAMLRLARNFVSTSQSAEDAVQDAWLGVLNGLSGFEGRASLRTWTFSILVNRAKSRAVREHRTLVSLQATDDDGAGWPAVDPDRFQGPDGQYPAHWSSAGVPQPWYQPERRAEARETLSLIERALQDLPARQRAVVTMRDVQGFSADEVCEILDLTPANQRVLLHRGRGTLRQQLEEYYRG
jgi:RNA polymerase sigma-70 factor, ECF subfamily